MRAAEITRIGADTAIERARRALDDLRRMLVEAEPNKPLTPSQARVRAERLKNARQALADAQAACARKVQRARERVASI